MLSKKIILNFKVSEYIKKKKKIKIVPINRRRANRFEIDEIACQHDTISSGVTSHFLLFVQFGRIVFRPTSVYLANKISIRIIIIIGLEETANNGMTFC